MTTTTKNEELHDDLKGHIQVVDIGGSSYPALMHPLVYQIPFMHADSANRVYKMKKNKIQEALVTGNYKTAVFMYERPHRFPAFLKMVSDTAGGYKPLRGEKWWSILGDVWTDSENIWQNRVQWEELFKTIRHDSRAMMTPRERKALRSFPKTVRVYRGAVADLNEDGLSWTRSRDKAEWFARRMSPENPLLITGTVPRDKITAYMDRRGEDEVIVADASLVTVSSRESLSEAAPESSIFEGDTA